jgi:hypothetical protein
MSEMETRQIPLKPAMAEYLDEVTRAYKLDDAGKAIRCLVNYARENPDKRDEIFGEMRCLDC